MKETYNERKKKGRNKGHFVKKSSILKRETRAKANLNKGIVQKIVNELLPGREIIQTNFLSKQMWCSLCKIPLSFDLAVQRLQKGLSNIYSIKCSQCAVVKQVYTNDVFDDDRSLFTINAKAAAGKKE